ncbi:MAG: FtsX-like permease family protein [Pseudomonadales bacterium]
MSEILGSVVERPQRGAAGLGLRIAWRNLWRNARRTWLTAGGVAFAVFLVVLSMCIQLGSYEMMEENATSLLIGHLQLQNADYVDSDRLEDTLADATALLDVVRRTRGVVAAAPRLEAFALASAGERSFGAQVLGVDPVAERAVVDFERRIVAGRNVASGEEGLLGEGLARNLGVTPGDEVVVLGTGKEGGVAALVLKVVGTFRTGLADLDRALLLLPIATMRDAFGLGDEVHSIAVRTDKLAHVGRVAERIAAAVVHIPRTDVRVRPWWEVLPELRQAIEVDRLSGSLFYWLIMILVAFSAVNTFIMTVFERTREFGMLLAIGMRPARIMRMLQWEALFLWALGAAIGLGLALAVVGWLMRAGISLGGGLEQLATQMYVPTRLYPSFAPAAMITAPLVLLIGTQLAALIPALRIRHLAAAAALRVAA